MELYTLKQIGLLRLIDDLVFPPPFFPQGPMQVRKLETGGQSSVPPGQFCGQIAKSYFRNTLGDTSAVCCTHTKMHTHNANFLPVTLLLTKNLIYI